MEYNVKLKDLAATKALAQKIAGAINKATPMQALIVAMHGELGSGKTTLIKHILQALGVKDSIKSPTYTIVEPYQINNTHIYHFDLYRFTSISEWDELGFAEYLNSDTISFIEWAEKAPQMLATSDWHINITPNPDGSRSLSIKASSQRGAACLASVMA